MKGAGVKLLLVEDDPVQATLYERVFGKVAARVDLARGVAEAKGLIDQTAPMPFADVTIVDVLLTDGSGFDVLDCVRERIDLVAMPVIVWSTSLRTDDVERGRREGASAVVPKPTGIGGLRRFASDLATFGAHVVDPSFAGDVSFGDLHRGDLTA